MSISITRWIVPGGADMPAIAQADPIQWPEHLPIPPPVRRYGIDAQSERKMPQSAKRSVSAMTGRSRKG